MPEYPPMAVMKLWPPIHRPTPSQRYANDRNARIAAILRLSLSAAKASEPAIHANMSTKTPETSEMFVSPVVSATPRKCDWFIQSRMPNATLNEPNEPNATVPRRLPRAYDHMPARNWAIPPKTMSTGIAATSPSGPNQPASTVLTVNVAAAKPTNPSGTGSAVTTMFLAASVCASCGASGPCTEPAGVHWSRRVSAVVPPTGVPATNGWFMPFGFAPRSYSVPAPGVVAPAIRRLLLSKDLTHPTSERLIQLAFCRMRIHVATGCRERATGSQYEVSGGIMV